MAMNIQDLKSNKMDIEKYIQILLKRIRQAFKQLEEQVVKIAPPVTMCGDIHGQFYDLMQLFKVGGKIPATKYLLLGDLMNQGFKSIETILLLALTDKHPERIFLLSKNHQSRELSLKYGFYKECKRKYGSANVWKCCTETFNIMSISALIGGKLFCVHGGLSP